MDRYLSLTQVAELFPGHSDSAGISPNTIRRWARVGVRGVKLATTTIGGRVYVSESALKDFIERCNVGKNGQQAKHGKPVNGKSLSAAERRRKKVAADCRERIRRKHGI